VVSGESRKRPSAHGPAGYVETDQAKSIVVLQEAINLAQQGLEREAELRSHREEIVSFATIAE
jgi:hypothetical protein